ncbi:hypothetical protein LCGC14_0400600 [marine sediment metagenome]|uniref:Tyr recombinase domain-containing protein n=1 Tax=marine sediment metagenome TaxID=412755 RepID=A0A0F9SX41_9ZZZZ
MKQPVSQLFEVHLSCGGYADSTIDSKQRAVRFFIKTFGDMQLDDVTYSHAEDFQRVLRQGGRGAKTINLYVIHLNHFFEWAIKRQYLKANPFFGLQQLKVEYKKQPMFSNDELIRLFNVARLRWKVLICFGLLGLREGEALNLVRTDLHFEDEYILVSPKKDSSQTWPWQIKNQKQAYAPLPKIITLPDMVIPFHLLLNKLIESLPPGQPYVCVVPDYYAKQIRQKKEGSLRFRKKLCPWGNFDRDFKSLLKKAWIAPKSFHDLRRTFVDKLRKAGYDLKEVQTLMRHSSISTTAKYYINIEEQELVARVNKMFEHYVTNVP